MRDDAIGSTRLGHYGLAGTGVALAEATIATAWNLQGNPARSPFVEEANRLLGVGLPVAPNTTARRDGLIALWLGPASWLLVGSSASLSGGYAATRDEGAYPLGKILDWVDLVARRDPANLPVIAHLRAVFLTGLEGKYPLPNIRRQQRHPRAA